MLTLVCFTISRKVKLQLKCKKRFVQCMEKVLWLIEGVKRGLRGYLVLLTFWPNNSLLRGLSCAWKRCLAAPWASTHWKPIPGDSDILKISKSNKVIAENEKNMSFILQEKLNGCFGQPNSFLSLCFKISDPLNLEIAFAYFSLIL